MTTPQHRRPFATTAPPPSLQESPRRFAHRVKRLTLALSVGAFGLAWALVSQNVVGATNATPTPASSGASATPHRATVPSTDFFGSPGSQPQPFLGNGGSGSGPVVRGRTS
jgi:hypothetical protein